MNEIANLINFDEEDYIDSIYTLAATKIYQRVLLQNEILFKEFYEHKVEFKTPGNLKNRFVWKELSSDLQSFPNASFDRQLSARKKTLKYDIRNIVDYADCKIIIRFSLLANLNNDDMELRIIIGIKNDNDYHLLLPKVIFQKDLPYREYYNFTVHYLSKLWCDCNNLNFILKDYKVPNIKNSLIAATSIASLLPVILAEKKIKLDFSPLYVNIHFTDDETLETKTIYYSDFIENPQILNTLVPQKTSVNKISSELNESSL